MNIWWPIGAVCLGAVAMTATACERSERQKNAVMTGPEQPVETIVQPIDDSKTRPMPMPSVNIPPVTEKQRARSEPAVTQGFEEGNKGEGNAPSN